jgi:hypothetical protein
MRLKSRIIVLACILSATAAAQMENYLGPGVLSRGAGDIGTRGGQDVDLRFYANVSGLYDNGLEPYALDSKGNLITVNGLYGAQADVGVYGTHQWRTATLGLDYRGNFYDYVNDSKYSGSTQNLMLGYTYQESRRLVLEFRLLAGTSSLGYGGPGIYGTPAVEGASDVVNQATTLLFDNRTYYTQSSLDVNYIKSLSDIFTFGAGGFFLRREASGLAGLDGYNAHGTYQHRLSRTRTVGFTYERMFFDYPPAFGQSDINVGQVFYADKLGRRWTFSIAAGAFQAEVKGIQQITLSPVVAALLGTSRGTQAFYHDNVYPDGRASLTRDFRTSALTLLYSQLVTPGNGVYLTSRRTLGMINYSYTGIRKWNFGIRGGYDTLESIGQAIKPYTQLTAGAGFTYGLTRSLHIVGRYDARHQEIGEYGFRATSYRATFGLAFSPGDIPLSLW